MPKKYVAVKDMKYPADEASLKAAKRGLLGNVEWIEVAAGTEDLVPYCPEILSSWQANGAVKEMKA